MRRVATAMAVWLLLYGTICAGGTFDDSRLIPAPAAGKSPRTGSRAAETGKPAGGARTGWWTTLGSLTAVLALVYLTARVLKKSLPAAQRSLPVEVVQLLGRKALDYRNSVHLVRCGSRLLILGSSQAGLTSLGEISDPVEVDYLAGLCKPGEPASVAESFNQLFRKFQGTETPDPGPEGEPAVVPGDATEQEPDPAVVRLQSKLQKPQRDGFSGNPGASHGEAAG
ncbi:MAG: FliO/MopB family protein [Planctomycetia bacterium]|nr:FliO/MopB family protein [Planctomycetia bacterium]